MRCSVRSTVAVAIGGLFVSVGHAQVFGSLANFDVVNNTGKPAYGFEIEIEDPFFDHTKIASVFGLNRSFGFVAAGNPLAVVRYGSAEIIDLPGTGVKIRYGGNVASGITTPSGTFNTPGESCWPGANSGWQANPCDHFGITTYGSPAVTKYSWLVETSPGSGVLTQQLVGIPAVNIVYTPPVPAPVPGDPPAPAVVLAVIRAVAPDVEHPEQVDLWGEPYWVKMTKTSIKLGDNIDLGDLLRGVNGNPLIAAPGAEIESEIEWTVLQMAPANHVGDGPNEVKEQNQELGDADKAIIRRYEFYQYVGLFNVDGSGEVMCDGGDAFGHACDTPFGDGLLVGINDLGPYVGQQMAGFNAVQAIPEPQTYAMLMSGLAVILGIARRRRPGKPTEAPKP